MWLVRQRLPELKALAPAAWPPGLVLVGAGALAWLLGEAGSVSLLRHLGLVLMLQGAVVALLGKAVALGLAFPIFYALFLVPFGDELVPPMQELTARMCMALLALVGVPAHLEGIFISTPTGLFRVAEACSGVRFLVAMAALAALVANLCFRSWPRRAAFVVAAMAIPIAANGVRAFATIWVAHLTDNEVAVGFDHIVYGWVFFGLVIAADHGGGLALLRPPAGRSPHSIRPGFRRPGPRRAPPAGRFRPPRWRSCSRRRLRPGRPRSAPPGPGRFPPSPSPTSPAGLECASTASGSRIIAAPTGSPWRATATPPAGRSISPSSSSPGRAKGASWSATARAPRTRTAPGRGPPTPRLRPDGKAERIGSHGRVREVASFYRVGDVLTGSEARVKLETVRARLLGGPQRAVALLVAAEAPADGISPRPTVDSFLRALGPIEPLADRAAGLAGPS